MKRMMESITGGYSSSARVVDNTLILTLPDAVAPVVWRLDLGQVRSSALEVRERDGLYVLTLKTPRADAHDVAPFAERGNAVRALMAVSRALEQGNTPSIVASSAGGEPLVASPIPAPVPSTGSGIGKWIAGIVAALFIAVVIFATLRQNPQSVAFDPSAGPGSASASGVPGATGSAADASGVPVSADQFLMQNSNKAAQ